MLENYMKNHDIQLEIEVSKNIESVEEELTKNIDDGCGAIIFDILDSHKITKRRKKEVCDILLVRLKEIYTLPIWNVFEFNGKIVIQFNKDAKEGNYMISFDNFFRIRLFKKCVFCGIAYVYIIIATLVFK